ncbi:hypothetical protein Tco_0549522, partial [Tanacetum coccineum]
MIAFDKLQTVRQGDEDLFREIAMLSGSARAVLDKDGIVEDASEIDKIGVNKVAGTTNLGEEVGPNGEKQGKEAKDEDVQILLARINQQKESFLNNHQDFHGKEQILNKRE